MQTLLVISGCVTTCPIFESVLTICRIFSDLNLGCPQRVAFAGHFGSFLLDEEDRPLVLRIVKKLSDNLSIPVFVKIRLLDSVPDTILLCKQLVEAGGALIAIHARYRVNLAGRYFAITLTL